MKITVGFDEYIFSHIKAVASYIHSCTADLSTRARHHDSSKLQEPEYYMFKTIHDEIAQAEFGSDEYKAILIKMGSPLQHHYESNRHHPEHFQNGVNDMNLLDLIEMVCDWKAAADARGERVVLEYPKQRFEIDDQLMKVIGNTIEFLENVAETD